MTVNNIAPTLSTPHCSVLFIDVCDFHWILVITEDMNVGGCGISRRDFLSAGLATTTALLFHSKTAGAAAGVLSPDRTLSCNKLTSEQQKQWSCKKQPAHPWKGDRYTAPGFRTEDLAACWRSGCPKILTISVNK